MEPLGMRRMGEHDIAAKDPLLMTEQEAYDYYAPNNAFVIDLPKDGLTFSIEGGELRPMTIDWGDGTEPQRSWSHTYAKAGTYVIVISDDVWCFQVPWNQYVIRALRFGDSFTGGWWVNPYRDCYNLAGPPARLGKSTTECRMVYYNCPKLTGPIPPWPDKLLYANDCYLGCTGLTGELPEWGKGFQVIGDIYRGCTNLRPTRIPEWPEGCTYIGSAYFGVPIQCDEIPDWPEGCTCIGHVYCGNKSGMRLTKLPDWPKSLKYVHSPFRGIDLSKIEKLPDWPDTLEYIGATYAYDNLTVKEIPAWPKGLKTITSEYMFPYGDWMGCYAGNAKMTLTSLPDWPSSLTNADSTFRNCTSLAATSLPDWSNCTALTQTERTYQYCKNLTGEVPAWPPNLTRAGSTFEQCAGLTGTIKAWPSTLTQAWWTFYGCKNLTGAWTSDPAELMPTNITSHDNCVSGASDALRALFYSDWGGTRTKEETTTT